MSPLRKLVTTIYNICMEDLDANMRATDHIEYIEYRLNGGRKSEYNWFIDQAAPIN